MNAALFKISGINGVIDNTYGVDIGKANFGSVALERLECTQIHVAKVPPLNFAS